MADKTIVVFRVWKKEDNAVIALFPAEIADNCGNCSSYMHVGQHSAADYLGLMKVTRPATPAEYAALQKELESAPYHYNLQIRRKYIRPRGK